MCKNKPGKVAENKSDVIRSVPLACADESTAAHFMEQERWGDSPCCPICNSSDVYQMTGRDGKRNKDYRWRCRGCGKLYSVRFGTVMEDSRIPLRCWCLAFWQACSSKKGMSAKQIQRQTGLSYKSALFLMHRVRFAMADMPGVKFSGIVECDETYVGGKPRYRGTAENPVNKRGRGTKKTLVFGMVERNGRVHSRVVPDVAASTLKSAIKELVDDQARIMTDENAAYRGIHQHFAGGHDTVQHTAKEYARGDVNTNTIEGVFALVKRGMYGVYHNVSKKHLHRYLAEFDFRYNTRHVDDGARTTAAIKSGVGKRLMYCTPSEEAA